MSLGKSSGSLFFFQNENKSHQGKKYLSSLRKTFRKGVSSAGGGGRVLRKDKHLRGGNREYKNTLRGRAWKNRIDARRTPLNTRNLIAGKKGV